MPGDWHEDSEASRRWSLPGKPCTFSPLGQGFLLLEVSELIKHVGEVAGVLLPTPGEGGARCGAGRPAGWQQHREGLLGRLPMHPEAVDAGVLRVAPVGQDPQLHHLVRGLRVLGREDVKSVRVLQASLTAQEGRCHHPSGHMPLALGPRRELDVKAPVSDPGGVSSWWVKESQRLQRFYRGHPPRTT